MAEAIEIAKLRLFLKMVAVVDVNMKADNLGLDPLPDIDFNIKCGNTLVGYATEKQLDDSITFGDMFARLEFKERIQKKLEIISKTYETFKDLQMNQQDDQLAFKKAKMELRKEQESLNEVLNQHLYGGDEPFQDMFIVKAEDGRLNLTAEEQAVNGCAWFFLFERKK